MKISILFGGISYEHEISIVSAITLIQKLGKKVQIEHCIFLDSYHDFYLIELNNMKSKYFSSLEYKKAKKVEIGKNGFYETNLLGKKKPIPFSILLNLIHGADGEDGVLASLLDFFNISYIGPRLEASVLSYNKYLTKLYAKERNVLTLPFSIYHKKNSLTLSFDYPVIIKPICLGSSIGVNVVYDEKDMDYALDSAFEFSDSVIIESFIKGVKEYNLAGTKIGDDFIFSVIEEPNKKDLLNFDDKYLDFSRTEEVANANISESLTNELKNTFKRIYDNMFEGAIIRCDFFVIDNKIYLNEINPIPGSMANYLFSDFENVIIQLANSLPKKQTIKINYQYINKIQHAKGR